MIDPPHQPRGGRLAAAQPPRQRRRLRLGEVVQLDPPADVEGRRVGVLDQLRGGDRAQKAERQPAHPGVVGAAVEARADRREELVGGERQPPHVVDLVDDEDHGAGAPLQDDVVDRLHPPLERTQVFVGLPELLEFALQVQLLAEGEQEAVVPLLGVEGVADGRQIELGDGRLLRAEPLGDPDRQRRLAHLPRRQDVAVFTPAQAVVEFVVRLPGDIRGGLRVQGAPARIEEFVGRGAHGGPPIGHLIPSCFLK